MGLFYSLLHVDVYEKKSIQRDCIQINVASLNIEQRMIASARTWCSSAKRENISFIVRTYHRRMSSFMIERMKTNMFEHQRRTTTGTYSRSLHGFVDNTNGTSRQQSQIHKLHRCRAHEACCTDKTFAKVADNSTTHGTSCFAKRVRKRKSGSRCLTRRRSCRTTSRQHFS